MEKMQESINKDLEELKNKHTETNNRITENQNTQVGINSRISQAEQSQRLLGQYQMHQHSNYRGPRRRRKKERV